MITDYIELTLKPDNTRHLIPIEAIRRVGEVIPTGVGIDGKPKASEPFCRLLVNNNTIDVVESYNDIKSEINKIGKILRNEQRK